VTGKHRIWGTALLAMLAFGGMLAGSAGRAEGSVAQPGLLPPNTGASTIGITKATNAAGGLHVRQGPGYGFASLGSLPYDTHVTIYYYEEGAAGGPGKKPNDYWDVIEYNGQYAFLPDYWVLTPSDGDVTKVVHDFYVTTGIAVETVGLPLDSSPGSGQIATIPDGSVNWALCYSTGPAELGDSNWDLVIYGNITGYVPDEYLYTGTNITVQLKPC
jgi:hypothetical protein